MPLSASFPGGTMSPIFVRFRTALPLVAVTAIGLSAAPAVATAATTRAAAASTQYAYQGDAFGTRATVGRTVRSGSSAPVYLGCTTTAGLHRTNTAAGLNLAPLLVNGTVTETADTSVAPVDARTSATVQNVDLLAGLIHAVAVRSVSSTTHDATGFHLSASGTTLTSLVVAGVPVNARVAANTRLAVNGFGYVVLNEQMKRMSASSASLTVNAIHLVITRTNALGLAVGTNVIVAHAASGLGGPVAGTLDGRAYGTSVKLGKVVRSGPSFLIVMPCLGTNGILRNNTGAGVNVPDVLASGTIRNTVQGTVDATTAMGETTSTVDRTNVLAGLVSATVIKADTHAKKNGDGTFSFSDTGSSFGSLSVNGHPRIGANVAANTQITIAGLGTLYLHRVIHKANSIEVHMIELVVTQNNPRGLPVGSDIIVAASEASAH